MSIFAGGAATTTTMLASAPSSMKLLIHTGAQRVLFAEAGKDVVDFILGLVAMPLGAVDRLLPEVGSLGSIGNVYASAEKMDAAYMQSTAARDALLVAGVPAPAPAPPSFAARQPADSFPFGTAAHGPSTDPSLSLYCTGVPLPPPNTGINSFGPPEPDANHAAALPLYLYRRDACRVSRLPPGSSGFVRDMAKYTVMDDLTVMPAHVQRLQRRAAQQLKSLGVKDLDALEERTVNVGHEEVKID